MTDITDQYVNWFRHSSPYINKHRGQTFVVMLPGDCIGESNFNNIISDLALLQSLGIKLVVVHGARKQIEAQLKDAGISSEYHAGKRVTPHEHISHILKAIGHTRFMLESEFSAGLPGSPMYGAKVRVRGGNFVTAMPQGIINGVDLQYTGKVRSIDAEAIRYLLNANNMVLMSPHGYSFTGEVFNLSFANVAVETAVAIKADKLIAYNDDGSICNREGDQLRQLTLLQCEKFLVESQEQSQSNTYFSLRACYNACDRGVARAHVISANEDGSLLKELFTREGSGTMVYRDHYETIRRARIEDVVGILNLIQPLEEKGVLVKRSRELLEQEIDHFTVMEKDTLLIGCAGLYPIDDEPAAELACMAIHPDYQGDGRATKLLTHLERQASKLKFSKLYALTTQAAHWFIEQGFAESHVEMLPVARKNLYNYQRKSKVFVKDVNP